MNNNLLLVLMAASLMACHAAGTAGLNETASVERGDALPANPLLEKAFTASVNLKDSTMSMLYGNTIAWEYASVHQDAGYPDGAVLYEVTWKQKPDPVWFGANVPKEIKSVERISWSAGHVPTYAIYTGSPLRKIALDGDTSRISLIVSQRLIASP